MESRFASKQIKFRFTSVDSGKNFGGILYDRIGDFLFQVNTSNCN